MPPSRSESCSPRRPTRRSGSTTPRPPRRVEAVLLPPPPPAGAPAPPPTRPARRRGILWLTLGFVALHILLDLYLDLAPGAILTSLVGPLPGTRLLEIFILWFPILLVAAFVSFGAPGRVSLVVRSLVLGAYIALLIGLTIPLFSAPDTPCTVGSERADCVASNWFDFVLRFAPIPAMFFVLARGYQWSMSRCVGVAFMFFSTWRAIHGSFPDLLVIAAGGGTPGPTPTIVWYRSFFLKVFWDLVYPLLGLLFFFHRVPLVHTAPAWGDELRRVLHPLGSWVRRTVPVDFAWGALLFFGNFVGSALIFSLLARTETEAVGDDSRVFDLLTLDQVFLLSIIAGVGEELIFRGLLQSGLERLLGRFRVPWRFSWLTVAAALVAPAALAFAFVGGATAGFVGVLVVGLLVALAFIPFALWKGPATVAIFVQSIAFAIVHAGYTDLNHVILPYAFGLFMGVVYRMFGILPAILIHIEIDVIAFGDEYARSNPGHADAMYAFLGLLILLNLVVGAALLLFSLLRWYEGRRRVLAVVARS
ncbi:MAG: CPBP family intramembrane metalloprotease [Euryarchaeota archaeon]|nr:CPBP family intramembrane metalloprotease [Euryarchaeota archaeon]